MPVTVFFDIGDTLVRDASWVPGARACMGALRAQGACLGIISNTGAMTRPELAALLPGDFDFDEFVPPIVLLSSEVGLEKPDPEIFRLALSRSETPPGDCLFVGENLEETWVAQTLGMRAVRVARFPDDFETITLVLRAGGHPAA